MKFEYWAARIANNESLGFSVGSFDNSDIEAQESFPTLLHLKMIEDIAPMDRGEKYEKPIKKLLDDNQSGVVARSGSMCYLNSDGLEIEGFELIIRVADEKQTIVEINNLLTSLTDRENFELEVIEEDIIVK